MVTTQRSGADASNSQTLPFETGESSLPIDTLAVHVVDGPNAGMKAQSAGSTLTIGTAQGNTLVLSDPTVSRFHVELTKLDDGVLVADRMSTNGTFASGMRIREAAISPGTQLRLGRSTVSVEEGAQSQVEVLDADRLGDLRGREPATRRLMAQVQKAAQTDASVLIVGESGTGKELIAQALHTLGTRRDKPLVTVDCGALASNLIASELFGHEKGAFTGAERRHIGAFERAHGGTLFLDEIGELPAELQPTLLGALERKRFRRVGGREELEVDVRVVSATNRDLRAEVNANTFRLDLYYRIAVVVLHVPPLRERRGDIPLLVEHFLRESGHLGGHPALSEPNVVSHLERHHWPGNVRELRNYVESTVAMGSAPDDLLGIAPADVADSSGFDPNVLKLQDFVDCSYKDARGQVLHRFEEAFIKHWLHKTDGNVARAAREAKMDRSHLFQLLRRHGLR